MDSYYAIDILVFCCCSLFLFCYSGACATANDEMTQNNTKFPIRIDMLCGPRIDRPKIHRSKRRTCFIFDVQTHVWCIPTGVTRTYFHPAHGNCRKRVYISYIIGTLLISRITKVNFRTECGKWKYVTGVIS